MYYELKAVNFERSYLMNEVEKYAIPRFNLIYLMRRVEPASLSDASALRLAYPRNYKGSLLNHLTQRNVEYVVWTKCNEFNLLSLEEY